MLKIMLPNLVPVQAPVQAQAPAPVQTAPVQTPPAKPQRVRVQAPVQDEVPAPVAANLPPVVGAPLVAVAQAPAGVQQLVGQVHDLVIQHVAVQNVVPEISTAMEVEDEDTILERLFFKRFGRALPEKEKEKDDIDQINMDLIDLTNDEDEMEVATSDVIPVAVVKTEPIEVAEVAEINTDKDVSTITTFANVNSIYNESGIRVSRRLELLELAKARKAITEFGKSLRKKEVIPEKEAPLAASSNVIADTDSNMSEDTSVNPESGNTVNTIKMAERAIAESDAAIEANRREFAAEFGDTNLDEFDD
jgi:hypothetical protein